MIIIMKMAFRIDSHSQLVQYKSKWDQEETVISFCCTCRRNNCLVTTTIFCFLLKKHLPISMQHLLISVVLLQRLAPQPELWAIHHRQPELWAIHHRQPELWAIHHQQRELFSIHQTAHTGPTHFSPNC